MINLALNNITGKKLYAVVMTAVKARSRELNTTVSVSDFCSAAGLSRTQLYAYNKGEKPGAEGVVKIASALKAWGNEVTLIF